MTMQTVSNVADTTISALKSTPALLAILLLNLVFIGIVAWSANADSARYEKIISKLIDQVNLCSMPGGPAK